MKNLISYIAHRFAARIIEEIFNYGEYTANTGYANEEVIEVGSFEMGILNAIKKDGQLEAFVDEVDKRLGKEYSIRKDADDYGIDFDIGFDEIGVYLKKNRKGD